MCLQSRYEKTFFIAILKFPKRSVILLGFIGNGSICTQPPKHETGFLIVSQGVATVKVSLSANKRSVPVSTAMM